MPKYVNPQRGAQQRYAPVIIAAQKVAPRPRPPLWQQILRQIAPMAIGILGLWLLWHRIAAMDTARIAAALHAVSLPQWMAALGATGLSFWAVGRYDAVVHRHLRTGFTTRTATRTGAISVAAAQTLGMGVLTGALARWRLLPDMGLVTATKISTTVALSFLAGWALITAIAGLVLPGPGFPVLLSATVVCGASGLVILAFLRPDIRVMRWQIRLPSLSALLAIAGFTLLDTLAAATALQVLLPDTISIGLQTLYPVFLLALGAALISGTPGGVGPFELAMLTLLPTLPEAELIAAIIAFRIVYYALPAVIAGAVLLRPRPVRASAAPVTTCYCPALDPSLRAAKRSELGVIRQNGATLLKAGESSAALIETAQTITQLFDPLRGQSRDLASDLRRLARETNKTPCVYKCSARDAAGLRRSGMRLLHVANEAVVNPQQFRTEGSAYRQLRRKLKQADKAGVTVRRADHLPLCDMAEVDAAWSAAHGTARGVSMGRYCAHYLRGQRVYLAYHNGLLTGFVSFHVSDHEICLDLMRARAEAPDGTMHALVHAAIADAASETRTRLSLAALPALPDAGEASSRRAGLIARLRRWAAQKTGGLGLVQFKMCFKPHLEPLYMAAPSWPAMALAAADLAREVHLTPTRPLPPTEAQDPQIS
ncbi:hypothetical protein A9Q95_01305 [Rhodobacterales bacterium 59_46_T64]|nr:hypothetical protein A9Q95_01305 [Rhodobacterales bacterium 59_46_T64]